MSLPEDPEHVPPLPGVTYTFNYFGADIRSGYPDIIACTHQGKGPFIDFCNYCAILRAAPNAQIYVYDPVQGATLAILNTAAFNEFFYAAFAVQPYFLHRKN